MESVNITYDINTDIVVNTDPVATWDGFIKILRDGEVLGQIDASFDFSKMPDHLHEMALQLLINRTTGNLILPSESSGYVYRYPEIKQGWLGKLQVSLMTWWNKTNGS
jgi:hypothetical protein